MERNFSTSLTVTNMLFIYIWIIEICKNVCYSKIYVKKQLFTLYSWIRDILGRIKENKWRLKVYTKIKIRR